ncbi:hypothetical protein L195_g064318, partial [Trifolium pratense]
MVLAKEVQSLQVVAVFFETLMEI